MRGQLAIWKGERPPNSRPRRTEAAFRGYELLRMCNQFPFVRMSFLLIYAPTRCCIFV